MAWVSNSWKAVPNDIVRKSIAASRFAVDYRDWHIAKHDVYGGLFLSKWVSTDEEAPDDADGADIADEFDDLVVEKNTFHFCVCSSFLLCIAIHLK